MSTDEHPLLKDEDKRSRIIDATRRSLAAKGFHRTTINDISRTSLMPKGAVQRLFPNKDALLSEAVVSSSRDTLSLARTMLQEGGLGPGAVHRLIQMIIPILKAPSFFQSGRGNVEWWAWSARNETGLKGFRETWREWRQALGAIIRAEVGDEVPEDDVVAMAGLMLAIYNGMVLHATLEGDELDIDAIMRFQQLGWDGIFSRVKEQNDASNAASPKDSSGVEEPNSANAK